MSMEGGPAAADWSNDVSRVSEGEWQEVHSQMVEDDPLDHDGPWRVVSSGAGLGEFSLILTETLPPFQIEVEVMGNPAVYGTTEYEPLDLEFVMGNGWKIALVRGEGIVRAGDLLVARKGPTIEELEHDDVSRET